MVFYEPGKTDHGLPRDPFKVSSGEFNALGRPHCSDNILPSGMRRPTPHRLDQHS
jgi:hypothetical protein